MPNVCSLPCVGGRAESVAAVNARSIRRLNTPGSVYRSIRSRVVLSTGSSRAPVEGQNEGDARGQFAHVVIRRQHLGASANDLGFERTLTGFRAHVSDFDRRRYGVAWFAKLHARHDEHHRAALERLAAEERRREQERREEERRCLVEAQRATICEKARKLGYRVEEKREGEKIRLVLVKRVY